ncbi:MAG: thiopeptide-type bacteriocin biosynthesis protein [Acidobacteriota bacterium]|nr:thiopeptide-type bacteriocin biosynthesis protein [Acidobacteriota bacterium]
MPETLCLFTLLHAPHENHEELLRRFVTPVANAVREHPELDSLFFARYNVPSWQLRFRILGTPEWVEGPVRELVERHLEPVREAGLIEEVEFATYDREIERYGGEEGMALAEKLFLYDSLACLDLFAAERLGQLEKTRREFSLVMAERLLDLLGFDRAQRISFYAYGYRWALEMKTWQEPDLALLEERYGELRPGLLALFTGEQSRDEALVWGGEAPARIAHRCLEASRPIAARLLAAHAAGRIPQSLEYLAWSYAHMHCNRLGIDPNPEAILRFFMHRLWQDESGAA